MELKHGTTSGYRRGCRCDSCRKAAAEYQAVWRRVARSRTPRTHGLGGYTSYGCRCEVCKKSYSSYKRQYTYGLTPEDVNKLLSGQNDACPLCYAVLGDKYVVDRNHRTGKVRGLLCPSCNQALGKFQDDASIIREAIVYLR